MDIWKHSFYTASQVQICIALLYFKYLTLNSTRLISREMGYSDLSTFEIMKSGKMTNDIFPDRQYALTYTQIKKKKYMNKKKRFLYHTKTTRSIYTIYKVCRAFLLRRRLSASCPLLQPCTSRNALSCSEAWFWLWSLTRCLMCEWTLKILSH